VVPVVSYWGLKFGGGHHEEPWFKKLRRYYGAHLTDAMDNRKRTIIVAVLLVLLALGSVPFLGSEFMPKLDEGSILIETRKLPSVSLPDSVEISTHVERIVRRFPEVKQVVTKLGRPDVATEAMGIYQGDVYVNLEDPSKWKTAKTKEGLIDALAKALEEVPGLEVNFTQPMAMRLDEVVSGVKADVAVKVFGPESAMLEKLGEEIRKVIEPIPGAADLQVEVLSGAAEIRIDVDREAIARFGLNVSDVRQVVETAVGGVEVTEVLDGPRRFGVVVRFPEEYRKDKFSLENLLLTAPAGERVPLSKVAAISIVRGPEAINHESGTRRLVVQTNVRGRDLGGFVAEAQKKIDAAVKLPAGYYVKWGGQFENQQRAMQRLAFVIPLSVAIIFLLLFVTFGLMRQAFLVLMNVPFALVGGIAALWLRGLNMSLSASVGFVALFGVAVLNGIVLITAVNRRRELGALLRPAILQAAATRLKPVMMTALVAALGFVPMALSHGAGAEIGRPLASVVIGGVTTSTLLTLIVLPTLYEMIEEWALRQKED
jgi:cobalt-zinc-cadmium resistance protein CzcA